MLIVNSNLHNSDFDTSHQWKLFKYKKQPGADVINNFSVGLPIMTRMYLLTAIQFLREPRTYRDYRYNKLGHGELKGGRRRQIH